MNKSTQTVAIIAIAILLFSFLFREAISDLIGDTSSAEWGDKKISFNRANSFNGDLTPAALYYLIGISLKSDAVVEFRIRYQEPAIKGIEELDQKGLVKIDEISSVSDGSPEMLGKWILYSLTESGSALLAEMELID